MTLPTHQRAVQLVAPDTLHLNDCKPVPTPGPHQVLGRVEVVGLCFSDLKLLKQFDAHDRKSEVVSGIASEILAQTPSYVPGRFPAVPGHEAVVTIEAVGHAVTNIQPGDRFLVQTDYRWLKTGQSNAAFGYNFEGALQEYVLMDQRIITDPDGNSMLMPADRSLPASAVALVEPWACVEDSYAVRERQSLKAGGRRLIVGDAPPPDCDLNAFLAMQPAAGEIVQHFGDPSVLADEHFDDVLFIGANADRLETVFRKAAKNALVLVAQCGERFGRLITSPIGRFHYGGVRLAGTAGSRLSDALASIPASGEIRPNGRIDIVGAGGPMGAMHVIRNLCQGVPGVHVYGGDMNTDRLAALERLARPLAEREGLELTLYDARRAPEEPFNYIALMVPAPALVAAAIERAASGAILNIFAGIPTSVEHPLDLNQYIEKQLYFIGTSGSVIEDMRIVLRKVTERTLDTNLSVAAISGLEGAIDGIRAVEQQSMPGKIIVYPSCRGLPLTPLDLLAETHPDVAAALDDGTWTKAAEHRLLAHYGEQDHE